MESWEDITGYIINCSFPKTDDVVYQPDEAIPLLWASNMLISQLLNTPNLKDGEKRVLLSVQLRIREKNGSQSIECGNCKGSDDYFDPAQWFPDKTYLAFQKEIEEASFLIADTQRDLDVGKGGYYVLWESRSDKKINAISVVPTKICVNISAERWALKFHSGTLYKIDGIGLRDSVGVCICLTFRIDSEDREQYILSDYDPDERDCRGVSSKNNTIRIWGVNNSDGYLTIDLPNIGQRWWTIFIEWTGADENHSGRFSINDSINGTFPTKPLLGLMGMTTYLGGKYGSDIGHFNGAFASLDIFRKKAPQKIPSHLIKLIIQKQFIQV